MQGKFLQVSVLLKYFDDEVRVEIGGRLNYKFLLYYFLRYMHNHPVYQFCVISITNIGETNDISHLTILVNINAIFTRTDFYA